MGTRGPKPGTVKKPAGSGRQKGTPNVVSATVKASLQAVYAARGGDDALIAWADENQTEFYKLWGRMLPTEVSGLDGGPVEFAGLVREVVSAKDTRTDR